MTPEDADGLRNRLRELSPADLAAVLWCPPQAREPALAMHAVRAELAELIWRVREPMAGLIRLKWWSETLSGARPPDHPAAAALREAAVAHAWPGPPLAAMAEGWARVFEGDAFTTVASLEAWAGEVRAVPLRLLAGVTAGDADAQRSLADACGHGGVALSIADLAVSAGRHRAAGRCVVPDELLAAAGLDASAFLTQEPGPGHRAALDALIGLGRDHLRQAREAAGALSRQARLALLPVAAAGPRLDRAAAAGPSLFTRVAEPSPLRLQWAIARGALSGRL